MTAAKGKAAAKKPPLAVLSKEALLASEDLDRFEVEIPEWGGKVILRQISRQEQVDCERKATVRDEIDQAMLQLYQVSCAMVEPKFSFDEIGALGEKNASVVAILVQQMLVLQGGGREALAAFNKSILG